MIYKTLHRKRKTDRFKLFSKYLTIFLTLKKKIFPLVFILTRIYHPHANKTLLKITTYTVFEHKDEE